MLGNEMFKRMYLRTTCDKQFLPGPGSQQLGTTTGTGVVTCCPVLFESIDALVMLDQEISDCAFFDSQHGSASESTPICDLESEAGSLY